MEGDQLHTFTNYGLQWSLKELDKEEFSTFKRLLKEKYSELTSCSLPWAEVDAAGTEGLAALLHEYYMGPLAWAVCINILEEMNLLTLAERARDEMKKYSASKISGNSEPVQTVHGPSAEAEAETEQAVERDGTAVETCGPGPGGAGWDYKAHVITRFTAELATHPRLQRADDWPELQELLGAFHADQSGFRARTVVLHGKPGTSKSALAQRLMLSWAQGALPQDPFSYAFFLKVRDAQLLSKRSFAKLITREWPDSQAPVEEILSQPERLLFVVDGFDDLVPELFYLENDEPLCGDWTEEQWVSTLLHSLLRKVLLPESSLLVTVTDVGLDKLRSLLQCPLYLMVGGMSLERRTQLLLDHITDDPCRTQLLQSVVEGHQLLDQCQVPTVCLLLGTALQLGRSVAPLCRTLTGLYAAFLFHQLRPREPLPRCLNQGERRTLKSLCRMAAEGVWDMRSVFYSENLMMHGVQVDKLSALFHMDILLLEDREVRSYTFLHPSLQEFCAALFYLLEGLDPGQDRHRLFLKTTQGTSEPQQMALGSHLLWMKRFLFGLMSRDVLKELEALLGCRVPLAVRPRLLDWVSLLAPQAATATPRDLLDAFHCLFETQDEKFVRSALRDFQEVRLPISQRMDLMAASFCLQHCQRLRKIQVDVRDLFLRSELAQACPMAPRGVLRKALVDEWWESFCSILAALPNLQQLHLGNSVLNKWAMKTLCVTLRRPTCQIRSLILKDAEVTPGLQYLWMTLIVNRNLRQLDLGGTALREEDLKVACQALRHPSCQLEALRLDSCGLTQACSPVISQMLTAGTSLKSLSLARNKVTDEGLAPLCAALRTSQCTLAELTLDTCGLTAAGCQVLAPALASSCSLTHLCLGNNQLGSDGMSLLCRPLRLPDCALQRLILNQCHLDVASCGFLALALMNNSRLTHLSLSVNPLEDSGVKLLCEPLRDPSCCLQDLELVSCQLTAACCESLSCVITRNKRLQSLDLAANALGDSGVTTLCEGLRQPGSALRRLGLEACRLTGKCCEALSSALTCRGRLTSLNLVCNDFRPADLALLCSALAQPSCSLGTLGLWKQHYPPQVQRLLEGVQQFKPQLAIIGDWYSVDQDRHWWKS